MENFSKLLGSLCRQMVMYWTDFAEISIALLRLCN